MVEITSLDGLVPLWHRSHHGNKPDVGMVVAEMDILRQHVPVDNTLVVGESNLLTSDLLPRLRAQGWGFLAPLPQNAALDPQ